MTTATNSSSRKLGNKKPKKKSYHHGDLQQALLLTARKMVEQDGVEALSLRKLAEQVGVSRTAAYHHFNDKNDLLIAIASEGFKQWQQLSQDLVKSPSTSTNTNTEQNLSAQQEFQQFFQRYIDFATNNPAIYQLMFGDTLWQNTSANEANKLAETAHPCFHYQLELTKQWQQQGILSQVEDPLRLTQVTWATMHGIARLVIDGVYQQGASIDDICQCAINLLTNKTS